MWSKALLPAVITSFGFATVVQAATYTFNNAGGNLATAGNWTYVSGTPDPASPPPANGDVGIIGVSSRFYSAIYGSGEAPPSELDIVAGGSVELRSTNDLGNHNFVLDGGSITTSANYHLYGDLFIKSDSTLSSSATTPNINALVQDYGGSTGSLNIAGSGAWRFSNGNNSYSGGTIIQSGAELKLQSGGHVLGTGDVTVYGTLDLELATTHTATTGKIIFDGGALSFGTGNGHRTLTTDIQLAGGMTVSAIGTDSAHKYLSGNISGTGTITKVGNSILTLKASNTYSGGTIITDGTVAADSAQSLGTGFVKVEAGGALSLAVANAIINGQGLTILDDGVNFGTVNLQDNAVTVATLTLGGVGINPGTYTATSNSQGIDFDNYFNGSGSITVVNAVPEPASLALLALGGLMMLPRRKRKVTSC